MINRHSMWKAGFPAARTFRFAASDPEGIDSFWEGMIITSSRLKSIFMIRSFSRCADAKLSCYMRALHALGEKLNASKDVRAALKQSG